MCLSFLKRGVEKKDRREPIFTMEPTWGRKAVKKEHLKCADKTSAGKFQ